MNGRWKSEKLKSLLPYFLLALAIIVTYRAVSELEFFTGVIRRIWGIITPFFYGFLLAYVANIPCNSIQKLLMKSGNGFIRRRNRALSVVIVLILFALVFALALNFIIPAVVNSVELFWLSIPLIQANIMAAIEHINSLDLPGVNINMDTVMATLGEMFQGFSLESLFENLTATMNALMGVGGALFTGLLAFISSIYILVEKDKFKAFAHRVLRAFASHDVYSAVVEYMDKLNQNCRQYIRTQTIDGLILGTLATILLFILGSPFFLVLGVMLGIVNYVPYFGSIVGTLVAVLVVAFTQGITAGVIATITLFVVQQIDANIIQPKLMSGSFSLSPLLVIISITVGGAWAGILGMLVAIPIVAVLKDMFEKIIEYYERKRFGDTQRPDKEDKSTNKENEEAL